MTPSQILGILAIVLIYGVLFYLWYSLKTQRGIGVWLKKNIKEKDIRVLEVTHLGFRTSLYLIDVRGKHFLILSSPQGVQLKAVDAPHHSVNSESSFEKILEGKK